MLRASEGASGGCVPVQRGFEMRVCVGGPAVGETALFSTDLGEEGKLVVGRIFPTCWLKGVCVPDSSPCDRKSRVWREARSCPFQPRD